MSAWLGPYRAILSARFRMLLQYRAAALAGLWTQIFFGLVLLMIYEGFYRSTAARQPMTFAEIVRYVWLGQALLAMLPWNADAEIRAMVRGGAVAYELCRPVDLYSLWYVRAVALRTAPTLLRAFPMCVFAAAILPLIGLDEWALARPPSIAATAAFGATLLCTLLLGCALTTLINISLRWTVSGEGAVILAISRGFDVFGNTVKNGDFDRILLRPRSSILQLFGHELTLRRMGRVTQGLAVLVFAIATLDIPWSGSRDSRTRPAVEMSCRTSQSGAA